MKWYHRPRWDGSFSWLNSSFLLATPLASFAAIAFLIYQRNFSWWDFSIFLFMNFATGLSITAGYHRLFSHQSYRASWPVEIFYLVFGAAALQNSAFKWASDHRYHHRFVDKEGDPYNIGNGFFYAHIGWIFYNDPKGRSYENAKDLEKSALVRWQHRYYWVIGLVAGFGLPTLAGALVHRPLEGFLWGGLFRTVFVHHGTFLINSAAHVFGRQTYTDKNSARDCWWLAFFTNGEGYHNFHHAFANDYRNGVRWYQWDPSKWLIFSLERFGLSSDLKRTPDWQMLRAQAEQKYADLQHKLEQKPSELSQRIEAQIIELRKRLDEQLQRLATLQNSVKERRMLREQRRQVRLSWQQYCLAIRSAARA